jgi:ubiquinone/menaquinone biosynthesis C-methylase UbiE
MSLTNIIYRKLIDPLLNSSHHSAKGFITEGASVLDVACGNGTLAFILGENANSVIGIDLDDLNIEYATNRAGLEAKTNIEFRTMDALDLSYFTENQFDYATISMAIHQFSSADGLKVLKEMVRVSTNIVIVDYSHPMPEGLYKKFTYIIERIAGGDHFRNFKTYMNGGGIDTVVAQAGLEVVERVVKGKGILSISLCKKL